MKIRFTEKEHTNAALALILLLLIIGLGWHISILFKILVVVVLAVMIKSAVIYPFTFLWLNLSDFLGKIMSVIILSLIYFLVVCPTALIRNLSGKDTLKLKQFGKSRKSVFTERNHNFIKDDLVNPY
jgi:hypothetical protein